MKFACKFLLLLCSCIPLCSQGQDNNIPPQTGDKEVVNACADCCCAFKQTPLGIMTDHIHPKGKWMISYSYMDMVMQGNRSGTSRIDDAAVYQKYSMSPDKMSMQMHMAMLMYGITDRFTVMGMAGFAAYNMSMNMSGMMMMPGMNMQDMSMNSRSAGITDSRIYGLYNFAHNGPQRLIGSLGIGIPTGSIKATGTTMLGDNKRLPYDMQPGTGSTSIIPGITYIYKQNAWSLGGDAGADIKLADNPLGYRCGDMYHAGLWGAYQLLPFVSGSLRAEGTAASKISGADPAIAIPIYEANDPTTLTTNYGGKWVYAYVGLNFHFSGHVLNNCSLLTEFGMPVYQDLNGEQMAQHYTLSAGLQYSF